MDKDVCMNATPVLLSMSHHVSSEQEKREPSSQFSFEFAQQSTETFAAKHRGSWASASATVGLSSMSSMGSVRLSTETSAATVHAWTGPEAQRAPCSRPTDSHRAEDKIRFTCRFDVGIEEDSDFRVVRRLIGNEAANMKAMVKKAGGSKIRIHGKGASKDGSNASDEPLHIVVGATSTGRLERAAGMVNDLISSVHAEYEAHCNDIGLQTPILKISRIDGVALPPDVRALKKH
jgi:hypothetical protein